MHDRLLCFFIYEICIFFCEVHVPYVELKENKKEILTENIF
jgi:hypothetical protein